MSSKTDYLENEILDHVLGVGALTSPTNVYLALFSVAPSEAGGGTELTGNGYARQVITFGTPASGGTISNTAAVTFTASGGAWSAVAGIAIMDALTVGNMLYYEAVSGPTLADGDSYEFAIGDIDVTEG